MTLSELTHVEILELLARKDVHLTVKQDRLQINAPPNAIEAELRDELVRRKADLLDLVRATQAKPDGIPQLRRTAEDKVPQTPAQQGLWLLAHFDKSNVAYNIPEAFLIEGMLQPDMVQRAVDKLIARHEVLRTSFHEEDGELFQRVFPAARATVGVTDLSSLPLEECERRAKHQIEQRSREPFDLTEPPLVRFHLFQLASNRSVVFLNIHHIIADRASLSILREDLFVLYQAEQTGTEPKLSSGAVQFGDYALWAKQELQSPRIKAQAEYWKRKLAGTPPYLDIPHSRAAPDTRSSWGAVLPITIDASLRDALNSLGQRLSATPFMVYLAGFAALLHRSTGAQDFCIGTPFTHRRHVETERTIGLFVNMLALRCKPSPEITFEHLVEQIRLTALEAYENGDLPFQLLLRALKPDRRSRRSPLFQVIFIFESSLQSAGQSQQLALEPGTARYDLTLHLTERDNNGITGFFEYCTDLFTEKDIERLADELTNILRHVAADATEALGLLPPMLQADLLSSARVAVAAPATAKDPTASSLTGFIRKLFTSRT